MTNTKVLAIMFAAWVIAAGCASSPGPSPRLNGQNSGEAAPRSAAPATESAHAPDPASNPALDSCDGVACESTTDCCKGYDCGFDPDRSRVQRYCLGS
jgi:hypothetical protein